MKSVKVNKLEAITKADSIIKITIDRKGILKNKFLKGIIFSSFHSDNSNVPVLRAFWVVLFSFYYKLTNKSEICLKTVFINKFCHDELIFADNIKKQASVNKSENEIDISEDLFNKYFK